VPSRAISQGSPPAGETPREEENKTMVEGGKTETCSEAFTFGQSSKVPKPRIHLLVRNGRYTEGIKEWDESLVNRGKNKSKGGKNGE